MQGSKLTAQGPHVRKAAPLAGSRRCLRGINAALALFASRQDRVTFLDCGAGFLTRQAKVGPPLPNSAAAALCLPDPAATHAYLIAPAGAGPG